MLRGRARGRRGWIAGDIGRLHPLVTRVLLHIDGDVEPIARESLARDDQGDLFGCEER